MVNVFVLRLASCVLRLACARCVRACIFFVPLKAARSGHFSRREPRAASHYHKISARTARTARTHARTHRTHARRNYFVDGPLLRVHSRSLSYFFQRDAKSAEMNTVIKPKSAQRCAQEQVCSMCTTACICPIWS